MSLDWVKLYADLPDHPKIKKLERAIGDRAFDYTVRALLWLSKYRPDGNTVGVEIELEQAVRYEGEQGRLISAWREKGWIDEDGVWHDWDEVQTAHKERADAKRRQSESRKRRRMTHDVDQQRTDDRRQMHLPGHPPSRTPSAPPDRVTVTSRDVTVTGAGNGFSHPDTSTRSPLSHFVTVTDEDEQNERVAEGKSVSDPLSRSVTVTSPLLSSPLVSSDPGGGPGEGPPLGTDRADDHPQGRLRQGPVMGPMVWRAAPFRERTFEAQMMRPEWERDRPKTAEELVERHGDALRTEHPHLGSDPRRLLTAVRANFASYTRKYQNETPDAALAGLLTWLRRDELDLARLARANGQQPPVQAARRGLSRAEVYEELLVVTEKGGIDPPPNPASDKEAFDEWVTHHRPVKDEAVKRLRARGNS